MSFLLLHSLQVCHRIHFMVNKSGSTKMIWGFLPSNQRSILMWIFSNCGNKIMQSVVSFRMDFNPTIDLRCVLLLLFHPLFFGLMHAWGPPKTQNVILPGLRIKKNRKKKNCVADLDYSFYGSLNSMRRLSYWLTLMHCFSLFITERGSFHSNHKFPKEICLTDSLTEYSLDFLQNLFSFFFFFFLFSYT